MVAVVSAIVTLPALIEVNIGTAEAPLIIPVAFYAVTSIAVIGLYLSFAIPIWLRWRHGDKFEVGAWNNGCKYKWMNPIAVAEIIIVSLYLMLPFVPGGDAVQRRLRVEVRQLRADRDPRCAARCITIWWQVSAKHWFKGPIHTIDPTVVEVDVRTIGTPDGAGLAERRIDRQPRRGACRCCERSDRRRAVQTSRSVGGPAGARSRSSSG